MKPNTSSPFILFSALQEVQHTIHHDMHAYTHVDVNVHVHVHVQYILQVYCTCKYCTYAIYSINVYTCIIYMQNFHSYYNIYMHLKTKSTASNTHTRQYIWASLHGPVRCAKKYTSCARSGVHSKNTPTTVV